MEGHQQYAWENPLNWSCVKYQAKILTSLSKAVQLFSRLNATQIFVLQLYPGSNPEEVELNKSLLHNCLQRCLQNLYPILAAMMHP
jgi:hypothetical protein